MFALIGNRGFSLRFTGVAGLVVIVLAYAGSYLWNLRPLSETERKLVGTWACDSDSRIRLRLAADRSAFLRAPERVVRPPHPDAEPADELRFFRIGSWSVSDRWLAVRNRGIVQPRRSIWSWFAAPSTPEGSKRLSVGRWSGVNPSRRLEVLDADYLKLGGDLYFRVREAPGDELSVTGQPAVTSVR